MRYGGLIAAIVFAAIAAIIVLKMSSGGEQVVANAGTPQEIKGIRIYVAKTAIPIGSAITDDMIDAQPWPEHLALEGFIKKKEGENGITGMVARAPFQQGEPIIQSKLANPNDPNFLAGDLPKGMRVVSIPLNEVDGVAGFVFPGDHVDLIYTHEVEKWVDAPDGTPRSSTSSFRTSFTSSGKGPEKVKQTITETLLTNVKVLAVDQRSSNVGSRDTKGNLIIPKSASIMVSQADAQRVRLAQKTGTVSLSLRSLADKESADPLILTEEKDISQDKPYVGSEKDSITIIRGAPKTPVSLIDLLLGAAGQAKGNERSNPREVSP